MYLIGAVRSRNDFAPWLAGMGLRGRAVEVGTHHGVFAAAFMARWPGTLACVDPWAVPPGYEAQAAGLHAAGPDREADYREAVRRLAPYGGRVSLLRATSAEAATRFADRSLDFVYLDGDHRPRAVALDLRLWWPKVRRGGVLAGHDIVCLPGPDNWGLGMQSAVGRFAAAEGLDVNLVAEPAPDPWSYYMVRE